VKRYVGRENHQPIKEVIKLPYNPFEHVKRESTPVSNIGGNQVPVVVADFMQAENITAESLRSVGYSYDEITDKWTIHDAAADYIYAAKKEIEFALPGTLKIISDYTAWLQPGDKQKYLPLFQPKEYIDARQRSPVLNFISVDANNKESYNLIPILKNESAVVLCIGSSNEHTMASVRRYIIELTNSQVNCPVILAAESYRSTIDEQLIDFSANAGSLLLDGMGDGVWLINDPSKLNNSRISGRTYLETRDNHQFLNNTSFSILQATRTRISKTEYISCPSCGRTLFDLQETTARIRAVTNHLKGIKIAIMGCIVNGPGEMADADFGYVGSGPGKITLYRGKEVIKRSVNSDVAVEELIKLLKENGAWSEVN
jgi:(E)-4-hydroxy-3-methylbut-2-enyl-diphosphate synthase